jgi:hypothetical protein
MPRSRFRQFLSRLFGGGRLNDMAPPDPARVPAPVIVPRAAPSAPPPPADPAQIAEEARDIIRRAVRTGFDDREQVQQSAIEMLEDEHDSEAVQAIVPALVDEEFAAHRRAQLGWPAITDCDRLDAAFAALDETGIIARQNFTCCGTCGSAEIRAEMGEARDAGRAVRGYGFYHMQDSESAAGGHGLYLNYGAFEEGEEAALAVGQEIVATLSRSGLSPDWDGSWSTRIAVPLDWKRRRTD